MILIVYELRPSPDFGNATIEMEHKITGYTFVITQQLYIYIFIR